MSNACGVIVGDHVSNIRGGGAGDSSGLFDACVGFHSGVGSMSISRGVMLGGDGVGLYTILWW